MSEPVSGRVAGSDTREAAATQTVRLVAAAAAFATIPGWSAAFGAPAALERWLGFPKNLGTWSIVGLVAAGLAAGIIAWRFGKPTITSSRVSVENLPPGTPAIVVVGSLAVIVLGSGSDRFAAAALVVLPAASGWFVGRAAQMASAACVPQVTPAAAGIVTTAGLLGVLGAGPLASVTGGSGFNWGAGWTLVCVGAAAVNLLRGQMSLPADRRRAGARFAAPATPAGGVDISFDCEGIGVSFGATLVLRGADLRARGGEFVALVGANGCGKTTLLRTAAGFIGCQSGRVIVAGQDVSMLHPEERAALGLAFVSGARPVFPDLTVLENLRVAAFNSHIGVKSFASASEAIFDLVPALAARRRARAGVLSGGEQRLLAVAQTLYRKPVALLADELTLGLALQARIAVLDLLRMLADEGVAVVAVDHDLPTLLPRSDRAVLLSEGVVRNFDDPIGLLDKRSTLLPATFLAEVPK